MSDKAIKKTVAQRAKELGGRVQPRQVTVEWMPGEAAPGCRVFHAHWGAGERAESLSGLVMDHDAPNTYPAQALGKIFRRWIEVKGALPDAKRMASISAFLYDPAARRAVVLTEDHLDALIARPEWLSHIRPPQLIEVAGQPGVAFWWVDARGPSELSVYLDKEGETRTKEKPI